MKRRFSIQRRGHKACSDCEYVLRGGIGPAGWKLECRRCGKFYGYVASPKDLELYRKAIRKYGSVRLLKRTPCTNPTT